MATTLSYGETITILLKAIVSVLAKGGQDPRKGSGFLGRQLLGSRLCTLAPGTIFAGGGGVAATFDVVRRGRRDPAQSYCSRTGKGRTRSSFHLCGAAALASAQRMIHHSGSPGSAWRGAGHPSTLLAHQIGSN